jgi:hypothetical protein
MFTVWRLLAAPNRQALSVQRVPAIVDRDYFKLRKMMGIMWLVRRMPSCPTWPITQLRETP